MYGGRVHFFLRLSRILPVENGTRWLQSLSS